MGVRGKADMEDRAAGRRSDCGVPRRFFRAFLIAQKGTPTQMESSAAPATGSFARGGKGTKTPFFRPLRRERSSGGQNLSGSPFPFRATGPWLGRGWGFLVSFGPPGFYHAVWSGNGQRADEISAPTKQTRSAILGWRSWFRNRFHNGQRKCGKFLRSRLVLFPIPGKTGHFLLGPRS